MLHNQEEQDPLVVSPIIEGMGGEDHQCCVGEHGDASDDVKCGVPWLIIGSWRRKWSTVEKDQLLLVQVRYAVLD
eukprot:CAMPEP_0180688398 /NCGR_PEP_ID=MMETSP1037_2-20121125/73953_1 /TAXON_ID=632150 /ORGANISM="Azadinium spinosum, Strain 3D9" /LENGTH=74 /DNA_ID=CAMNT_0022719223 /DNA_START=175 /DNA_END=396 /DNA_ORIENTATION=-